MMTLAYGAEAAHVAAPPRGNSTDDHRHSAVSRDSIMSTGQQDIVADIAAQNLLMQERMIGMMDRQQLLLDKVAMLEGNRPSKNSRAPSPTEPPKRGRKGRKPTVEDSPAPPRSRKGKRRILAPTATDNGPVPPMSERMRRGTPVQVPVRHNEQVAAAGRNNNKADPNDPNRHVRADDQNILDVNTRMLAADDDAPALASNVNGGACLVPSALEGLRLAAEAGDIAALQSQVARAIDVSNEPAAALAAEQLAHEKSEAMHQACKRLQDRLANRAAELARGWEGLFGKYDLDGDGGISFDEMAAAVRGDLLLGRAAVSDEDLRELWELLDADKEGSIEMDRVDKFMTEFYPKPEVVEKPDEPEEKEDAGAKLAKSSPQLGDEAAERMLNELVLIMADRLKQRWPTAAGNWRKLFWKYDRTRGELHALVRKDLRISRHDAGDYFVHLLWESLDVWGTGIITARMFDSFMSARVKMAKDIQVEEAIGDMKVNEVQMGLLNLIVDKLGEELKSNPEFKGSWKRMFRKLDEDGGGDLSYREIKQAVRVELKLDEHELSDADVKELWDGLDPNGSGGVTLQEFMFFVRRYERPESAGAMQRRILAKAGKLGAGGEGAAAAPPGPPRPPLNKQESGGNIAQLELYNEEIMQHEMQRMQREHLEHMQALREQLEETALTRKAALEKRLRRRRGDRHGEGGGGGGSGSEGSDAGSDGRGEEHRRHRRHRKASEDGAEEMRVPVPPGR